MYAQITLVNSLAFGQKYTDNGGMTTNVHTNTFHDHWATLRGIAKCREFRKAKHILRKANAH